MGEAVREKGQRGGRREELGGGGTEMAQEEEVRGWLDTKVRVYAADRTPSPTGRLSEQRDLGFKADSKRSGDDLTQEGWESPGTWVFPLGPCRPSKRPEGDNECGDDLYKWLCCLLIRVHTHLVPTGCR